MKHKFLDRCRAAVKAFKSPNRKVHLPPLERTQTLFARFNVDRDHYMDKPEECENMAKANIAYVLSSMMMPYVRIHEGVDIDSNVHQFIGELQVVAPDA